MPAILRLLPCLLVLLAGPCLAQAGQVERVLAAAHGQVGTTLHYDGSYRRLDYPGGDVPADRGVCTDVVVRALRAAGLDLQQAVHEDMRRAFSAYPALWGLSRPDRNIDHRRVPNLETWLRRQGHALPVGNEAGAFRPGDLVSWRLPNGLPHIGIVSDRRAEDGSGRWLVVHNIGAGTRVEDVLLAWPVVGHFRLFRDVPAATGAPEPVESRLSPRTRE
ncbi:DUF1287 domain-containing protein [Arenimonas soli]|uniref:DUF1287 domain-containing protein n=1 Tax=Arenimonas soli TaxID=2269504 RepID=A0ABQ1HDJ5_9GAMM|nr:DUF1287 domain-containing protein [Arenimonas soli]GGA72490.1 DUF1287 domain-containing protein [Arenimonas soli]